MLDLDGEISLHLRRLSKRDATTKLKALQVPTPTLLRLANQCTLVPLLQEATSKVYACHCGLVLQPWQ